MSFDYERKNMPKFVGILITMLLGSIISLVINSISLNQIVDDVNTFEETYNALVIYFVTAIYIYSMILFTFVVLTPYISLSKIQIYSGPSKIKKFIQILIMTILSIFVISFFIFAFWSFLYVGFGFRGTLGNLTDIMYVAIVLNPTIISIFIFITLFVEMKYDK